MINHLVCVYQRQIHSMENVIYTLRKSNTLTDAQKEMYIKQLEWFKYKLTETCEDIEYNQRVRNYVQHRSKNGHSNGKMYK